MHRYWGTAVMVVILWLAVNLLGCLTADDYDFYIVPASKAVAASLDTPDDLKHPCLFPLSVHALAFNRTFDLDSLSHNARGTPSVLRQDPKPHRLRCVLLL